MSPTNEWPPANPHVPYVVPMTADRPVADRELLSAEEEAHLRRDVEDGDVKTGHVWRLLMPRLLATLDAARAHPDEAGLRTALALMQELVEQDYSWAPPRPNGGRADIMERAAAFVEAHGLSVDRAPIALAQPAVPVAGAEDVIRCVCGEIEANRVHHETHLHGWHPFAGEVVRAAQPEDDGLDVERLTRAMERAMAAVDDEWTIPEFADITTAEYRRLSESSEGAERRDGA